MIGSLHLSLRRVRKVTGINAVGFLVIIRTDWRKTGKIPEVDIDTEMAGGGVGGRTGLRYPQYLCGFAAP